MKFLCVVLSFFGGKVKSRKCWVSEKKAKRLVAIVLIVDRCWLDYVTRWRGWSLFVLFVLCGVSSFLLSFLAVR